MKEKRQKIFNILYFVLLVICVVKINSLQNYIENLERAINNESSMLRSSIDSISSNVRYEMEKAENLVTDSDFSVKDADVANNTVTLSCYIVPKEYNPDVTQASILCNGAQWPMNYENGRYVAEITADLFKVVNVDSVQFNDNGTIRTHQLNWYLDPKDKLLPQIFAHNSGSVRCGKEEGFAKREYNQTINMDIEIPAENIEIVKAELVAYTDYKETFRKEIEYTVEHTDTYNGKPLTKGYTVCTAELSESFDIPFNSNFRLYTELTDNTGLVYRNVIDDVTIANNGEAVDNYNYIGYESDIYTSDGKPMYLKENDVEYN